MRITIACGHAQRIAKIDLITREIKEGAPPKVEYSLTKGGEVLRKSVIPLLKWAANYTRHTSCPILGIVDEHAG